jgi:hypothetical protein
MHAFLYDAVETRFDWLNVACAGSVPAGRMSRR